MNYQAATGLRCFMSALGAVFAKTADEASDFAVRHSMTGRKALEDSAQLSMDGQAAYRAPVTGTCRWCGCEIRRSRAGHWGLRRNADLNANDGRPWYCIPSPNEKRHEPATR